MTFYFPKVSPQKSFLVKKTLKYFILNKTLYSLYSRVLVLNSEIVSGLVFPPKPYTPNANEGRK